MAFERSKPAVTKKTDIVSSRKTSIAELFENYNNVIGNQLENGVIEKVERFQNDGRKQYIPHHVVLTPEKSTSKLRMLYDAFAKTRKNLKNLNECLYRDQFY